MCEFALAVLLLQAGFVRNVPLSWDAMAAGETWTEVRLYEKKADSTYTLLGSVGCLPGPPISCPTSAIVAFADKAAHNVIARSYDAVVALESDDSNTVALARGPFPPGHLKKQ